MIGLLSSQSTSLVNPSPSLSGKSVAIIKSAPSQFSSMPLLAISTPLGLTAALLSSQSTSLVKPSLSASTGTFSTKSAPSQSSSMPLLAISTPLGLTAALLSSQSTSLVKPSLSASTSPVLSQLTLIEPLWKLGIINCPFLSTASIEVGVPEKLMTAFSIGASTGSKQTWNRSWSSGMVTPVMKVSSHPTLKIPAVLLLKLLGPMSGIPKD